MIALSELKQISAAVFRATPGNMLDASEMQDRSSQGGGQGSDSSNPPRIPVFDEPLVGVAAADDELFIAFKNEETIGPLFMLPEEWLKGARSVVSLFFPFAEAIRSTNLAGEYPSLEWMKGKFNGQQFIHSFMRALAAELQERGWESCIPWLDERYASEKVLDEDIGFHIDNAWSERHVAYACGLGTFGLSRGLIKERGVAGRFGSLVTTAPIEVVERPYTAFDEYCTRCGVCIERCPVGAITLEHGKDNEACEKWLSEAMKRIGVTDGCGKCQVQVPCESCRP